LSDGRKGSLMRLSPSGRAWFALTATAVGVCSAQAGELVVNGGFETGAFFPWIAPPNVPNQSVFRIAGTTAHSGDHYAKLASSTLLFVNQFLPTTAGQDYELSFWLRKPINTPSQFYIRWEGSLVYSQSTMLPDGSNWHRLSLPLHSNFSGSLLEFGQDIFPAEYHLDDVSVVPAPAPSAAALLLTGGAAAALRRRRR